MAEETWVPIEGFEGYYEVSDQGRVRSLTRRINSSRGTRVIPGRVRKPNVLPPGHLQVILSREGTHSPRTVHRLVAFAFLGAPPEEGMEVCHNDGNPANNVVSNLRWDTRSANIFDRVRHGTHTEANKTHCKYGHEFTPENTYVIPSRPNVRYCRECKRKYSRERMRRVRGMGVGDW